MKGKKICANPNDFSGCFGQLRCAKERKRTESWICCINHQFLCKETEGKFYTKERKNQSLESLDDKCAKGYSYAQKTLFKRIHSREEKTALVCTVTSYFPFQSLENLRLQYVECKFWSHCVLEVQKEWKCVSMTYAIEGGKPREISVSWHVGLKSLCSIFGSYSTNKIHNYS